MNKKDKFWREYAQQMEDCSEALTVHINRQEMAHALIDDEYHDLVKRLIELTGASGEELLCLKAEARKLHDQDMKLRFKGVRLPITMATLGKKDYFAVVVSAILVAVAALASVYTVGYVRGENAAMETEVAR